LEILKKNANICRFLHLSIQSGSDRILSAMNRPYQIDAVADFVKSAHERLGSSIMLGADIITGFPGETIEDFNATRSFLADNNFTNVHAFPFSERPGTRAATMVGSVPVDARRERARIIIDDAAVRRRRFAESFIGREVEVCIEGGGEHGWTGEYLKMKLASPRLRRSLVRTTVAAAKGDILIELPIDARQRI
jgi:threonylcarbamoyladenosine tRNA methylthiotransferase MtaB